MVTDGELLKLAAVFMHSTVFEVYINMQYCTNENNDCEDNDEKTILVYYMRYYLAIYALSKLCTSHFKQQQTQ